MGLDWKAINKALSEHWGIVTAPMLDNRHHYAYNPERLNYADFLKAEERRQEMASLFTKNETDIALLRRCIEEKWIPIYEGKGSDMGTGNCPLCTKYGGNNMGCTECPIRESTGQRQCNGTPYETLWMEVAGIHHTADTPERKLAALQEITYLEGLIAKLTKAEETKKEIQAIREKAKMEQEKKVYHPFVYYIALEEPVENYEVRLELARKVAEFLKEQGMKVKNLRYGYGKDHHLLFSPKTGNWGGGGASIIAR